MTEAPPGIREFWQKFCAASGTDPAAPYQFWHFGSDSETATELAELVLRGRKTATASLVEYNETHPETAPIEAGYSVVTNFEDAPLGVVRTAEIRHVPFDEVDAAFAADEGEGDLSLGYWRDVHRAYFTKEAAANGLEFNEKSLVCCERFELLYPKS